MMIVSGSVFPASNISLFIKTLLNNYPDERALPIQRFRYIVLDALSVFMSFF